MKTRIATSVGIALMLATGVLGTLWPLQPLQTAEAAVPTETKLTAGDAAAGDRFGFSVAVDGDTAVVGAFNQGIRGSAYVFLRSGTTWSQQAMLTAGDAAPGDQLGKSVAISGDTAVVGAHFDDDQGNASGSAYVFVRSGNTWSQQAKLTASDGATGDEFGISVAISGETVVVGARRADRVVVNAGAAYVFVRSGTTWSQQAKLTASDAVADDLFGLTVVVGGNTALVAAFHDDDQGTNSGSVYAFIRSGSTWSQQQKLIASDGAAFDRFGNSVAIDGDTVVVGGTGDDDQGSRSGSAYVFVHSGTTWSQQAKLTALDGAAAAAFVMYGGRLEDVQRRSFTCLGGSGPRGPLHC